MADDFLSPTPRQTEGPFYPNHLPADTDNDLVIINQSALPALGQPFLLSGRVLTTAGEPLTQAVVEIWQVDSNGIYMHTQCPDQEKRDLNFQGFGRCLTGPQGDYCFRTILPVPYTIGVSRTPHVHVIVLFQKQRLLTTQLYIKGHPLNDRDSVLLGVGGPEAQARVTIDFPAGLENTAAAPVVGSDLVVDLTGEDPAEDQLRNLDGILLK